ncbi:MAG TPA: glycosyltransferase [Planctomycetaceae bacterium]|nr:glycosyltransferase [Planctomycetaceae bacterium]
MTAPFCPTAWMHRTEGSPITTAILEPDRQRKACLQGTAERLADCHDRHNRIALAGPADFANVTAVVTCDTEQHMSTVDTAIIVTTYERPASLEKVLLSIAQQRGVRSRFELVVADDGSRDETADLVRRFAADVDFPVRFVTHEHQGFHAGRCRNEGVRATTASYLLFLDGDCLIPPYHLAEHHSRRRPGVALASHCCYLSREASAAVTGHVIRSGGFAAMASVSELRRLAKMHRRAWYYNLVRHPTKPKMFSGDMSLWRNDFLRVNGFDENFRGWGGEDDDFRLRLRQAGVRIQSILRRTRSYHLWHPPVPSKAPRIRDGPNVPYLLRPGRLTRCVNGLEKRRVDQIQVRVIGAAARPEVLVDLLPQAWLQPRRADAAAEVEILVHPGKGRFSGQAELNLLIILDESRITRKLVRRADVVLRWDAMSAEEPRQQLQELRQAIVSCVMGRRIVPAAKTDPALRRAVGV